MPQAVKGATSRQDVNQGEAWIYNQRTGQLRGPDGVLYTEPGYSGAVEYKNNPEAEHLPDMGPIPAGEYRIGGDIRTKGPLTLTLEPVGHDAHGRTHLRIHGDSRKRPGEASEGCIVLPRVSRERINASSVRRLRVVNEPEWTH